MSNYKKYQIEVAEDIQSTLDEMGTQPILFVGSGLSKRYFNGPNWIELLEILKQRCKDIETEVGYYIQDKVSLEEIGSIYTENYRKWAWKNKENFPEELFAVNVPKDAYIKYEISKFFQEITPSEIDEIKDENNKKEIELLKNIQPHAVITTNYDNFIESILPDYQPIIGQQVLRPDTMSIGEIFKIHGCITKPQELIFNQEDYDVFIEKKKYLSAKLLTFFAEHPLLFIGYSGNDKNIQSILSDIDEIISTNGELIPNIYFLSFNKNLNSEAQPSKEKIFVINKKEIRVKYIETDNFSWVFETFSANKAVENVHPKLLRALLARTYKLVRSDIPRRSVEVDFEMIRNVVEDDESLPKLYGVSFLNNPSEINIQFPLTLTDVGKKLGFNGWHGADNLILQIQHEKGNNIKKSDNIYHVAIPTGSSKIHKYSQQTIDLLRLVKNGEAYDLNI
ncbi:ABC transporter [Jeotgalibacillus malaysiensis]|uniref:ABC transporter n=1 Tax=Jeotgalibacillus malaysiensis TaxID=1508404 RepID=A0A0B5ANI2_9BACL|nr:SIR2 family protein [Jeotgalibacillus malaysiensis]AJD90227.1 ABC transporter [Jeotgalibacillus malaysiensis]